MKLNPRDLYRLRRLQLEAERRALRARLVHLDLQELALELERRYDLLGKEASLDLGTGTLTEVDREPDRDAHAPAAGPPR